MDPDDDSRFAAEVHKDLPQVSGGGWGPVGRIEQAGKMAAGLRQKRTGWRKVVVRIGLALLASAALAVMIAMVVNGPGR